MADNTVTTYATDDISGTHYPRVKVSHGPDGEATDVSQASPMPVQAVLRADALYVGSVSATPVRVILSASSSSTITLAAAQASAQHRVLSYVLILTTTGSVQFGSSTTPLTGMMQFDAKSGVAADFNPYGHFQTGTNQPLTIITGAGAAAGHITYVPVSV